jgi:TolB-like protein
MRKPIRLAIGLTLALIAASPLLAAESAKQEELVVVIFPFSSPDGGTNGRAFAESLGLRAKRLGLVTVEHLSLKEAMAGAAMPKLDTPPAEMAKILKDRFGARFGLWGEVRQEGDGVVMEIRALDAKKDAAKLTISKTYRAAQKQLVNPVQDQVLQELTGLKKKPVAEATPEADAKVPTTGPELARNGGFEEGDKTPTGWQRIDGLTTFWPAEGQAGKGLKIVTDVYHDQWVEWQKKYKAGASATEAPKAAATSGNKYDTVAGLYGVAYDSDPIPVRPGKSYKVSISYKGKSDDLFFPKLFIRGWGDVGGEKREVFDSYLALRCKTGGREWESNVRIVEIPTDTKAPVEYVKLKIYAYWPPGTFYFDNVSMKEVAK